LSAIGPGSNRLLPFSFFSLEQKLLLIDYLSILSLGIRVAV
jgi:hypothetical protein